jgi:hypothetical protein
MSALRHRRPMTFDALGAGLEAYPESGRLSTVGRPVVV